MLVTAMSCVGSPNTSGPTAPAGSATAAPCATVEPASLGGAFDVAPGDEQLQENRTLAFADGTVGASFVLPARPSPHLQVSVVVRSLADAAGYRVSLRVRDGRLTIARVLGGVATQLGEVATSTPPPGTTVRLELDVSGSSPVVLRARAWEGSTPSRHRLWATDDADERIARTGWGGVGVAQAPSASHAVNVRYRDVDVASPEPTGRQVEVGIYNGRAASGADARTRAEFGALPALAAGYYLHDHTSPDNPEERARMVAGTSPVITMTTGGNDDVPRTQYLAALAQSLRGDDRHRMLADARAWFDGYLEDLAALAATAPDVPVYASIEHEFGVKVVRGRTTPAGPGVEGRSADPAGYAAVLDEFIRRVAALQSRHPNLRSAYWFAGVGASWPGHPPEQAVHDALSEVPDVILFDPYATTGPGETIASIAADELTDIRSRSWYVGQPIGLGEFGMEVRFGDAALDEFYRDVPGKLANLGLDLALLFNREGTFDTLITGRPDGREFPAAVAAFADSLTCRSH